VHEEMISWAEAMLYYIDRPWIKVN